MIVIVNSKDVTLALDEIPLNSGEYNVHECEFQFSQEYDNLLKTCVFTKFGVVYKRDILNSKCEIPYEVLSTDGKVTIGVYGYEIENDKIKIRYSPKPASFNVDIGSYEADNEEGGLSPSDYEMLLYIIAKSIEEVKEDYQKKLTAGQGIDIDQNDVISTNLFIPSKTSDLRNDSDFVNSNATTLINYGHLIEMSINTTTFVLTCKLKNYSGVVLAESSIDLPIESMIIGGNYDSQTKELILTLQSGDVIRINISDIITGLVPTSRKIAGIDLVDDITKSELLAALNVEDGSEKNIINSITLNNVPIMPDQNGNISLVVDLSNTVQKTGDTMSGTLVIGTLPSGETIQTMGEKSLGVGSNNFVHGDRAVAIGTNNASLSDTSFTQGNFNTTVANSAHAEGTFNLASGSSAHAEGGNSTSYKNVGSGTVYDIDDVNSILTVRSNSRLPLSNIPAIQKKVVINDIEKQISNVEEEVLNNIYYYKITVSSWYESGTIAVNDSATFYMQISCLASGASSHAEGMSTIASNTAAHSEGNASSATGVFSHAEGNLSIASGEISHAEGNLSIASGTNSHAEGSQTVASANYSHAEGNGSSVIGGAGSGHAEGIGTTANTNQGPGAHAEGYQTTASNMAAHAEGGGTKASSAFQHAQGKYNVEDNQGNYAHIVGNGSSDNLRSNAHTVDWSGNAWYAGIIKIGGASYGDANAKELATKDYVNGALPTRTSELTNNGDGETFIGTVGGGYYCKMTTQNSGFDVATGTVLYPVVGGVKENFHLLDSRDVISSIDNSNSIPTSNAVKTYVDNAISASITQAIGGSY